MATSGRYLQLMIACQVVISCYGAYQSYAAITNLRKYEEISKKAAKWSREADHQLQKTRTTQASGALAVLATFIAAVVLAIAGTSLPAYVRFAWSPIMLVVVLAARYHIKNYWAPNGKTVGTRIPLPNMEDYNEAQRRTEDLLTTLEYLEYGWVGITFVSSMLGFP